MKLIGLIAALGITLVAATPKAQAQVAQQLLHFSIVGQFGTNSYSTNALTETTNETLRIGGVLINTRNIIKAIAVDLAGKEWTNWLGSSLVRETDLTTGAEGIFLRKGKVQTNVSAFFGDSFVNNFTADAPTIVNGYTNTVFYTNGILTTITNAAYKGVLSTVGENPTVTNKIQSASLFSLSVSTSNMKFNLLTYGTTTGTNLVAKYQGASYEHWVDTIVSTGVGNFAINLGTNIFFGPNLYETTNFVSGPAHGSFSIDPPVFSPLVGP